MLTQTRRLSELTFETKEGSQRCVNLKYCKIEAPLQEYVEDLVFAGYWPLTFFKHLRFISKQVKYF